MIAKRSPQAIAIWLRWGRREASGALGPGITTTRHGGYTGKGRTRVTMVATMAIMRRRTRVREWGHWWPDTMTTFLKRVGRADKRVASIT